MASWKRALAVFLLASLCLYGLSLFLLSFLARPERLQALAAGYAKDHYRANLEFKNLKVGIFPSLTVRADEFVFEASEARLRLSGKDLRLGFAYWPGLVRRFRVRSLRFSGGECFADFSHRTLFAPVHLRDVELRAERLSALRPARVDFEASYVEVPRALRWKGTIASFLPHRNFSWKSLGIEGELRLERIILSQLGRAVQTELPFVIKDGQLNGTVQVSKSPRNSRVHLRSDFQAAQLIYQMRASGDNLLQSPPMELFLKNDLAYDAETHELEVRSGLLGSPAGQFTFLGRILASTGELREMRINAAEIQVAEIPQYALWLTHLIPARLGFSGASSLEASLEGTWGHLSVDASWDLASTLLTYSSYFSKPKDKPLTVLAHLLVEDADKMTGDFSVRLEDMTGKGTLTGVSLKQGTGQVSLISNKFSLAGWEGMIPPLSKFTLGGETKILVNFSAGTDPKLAGQNMLNLTFHKASLERPGWPVLGGVSGAIDINPYAIELKKGEMQLGDSRFEADLSVYHAGDDLQCRGTLKSPELDPRGLAEILGKISAEWDPGALQKYTALIRNLLGNVFPAGERLQHAAGSFQYDKGRWVLEGFEFEGFGGQGKLGFEVDLTQDPLQFKAQTEVRQWDLGRFRPPAEGSEPAVTGKLFLTGSFSGQGRDWTEMKNQMAGEGLFSITEGELRTVDFLSAIGEIDGFGEIGLLSTGKTGFRDVRGRYRLQNQKIAMEDLNLFSSDISVEGSGEAGLDGTLNYRLDTYLSAGLTEHFLRPILGTREDFQGRQFGPVPLLLSGPLAAPEFKADSRKIDALKNGLFRKKTQQILRNFVPENEVFKAPEDSPAARP